MLPLSSTLDWRGREKREKESKAEQGRDLPPSLWCFLVYYWFDTQLPQQPPERSPGQPDEMPGTGERLTATTAEENRFPRPVGTEPGSLPPNR